MSSDEEFNKGDAGSTGMEKVSAGGLKNGSLVMIKEKPCKVVSFSTAKVGKHGSAKAMITGIDIFTNNKLECTFSTGEMVDAPLVKRTEYLVINIDDEGYLTLLKDNGDTKEDLKLPEDEHLKETVVRIKEIFEAGKKECLVTGYEAIGIEKILLVKEGKDLD